MGSPPEFWSGLGHEIDVLLGMPPVSTHSAPICF